MFGDWRRKLEYLREKKKHMEIKEKKIDSTQQNSSQQKCKLIYKNMNYILTSTSHISVSKSSDPAALQKLISKFSIPKFSWIVLY